MNKIYLLLLAACACHICYVRAQGYGCLSNLKADSLAQFNPSAYSQFLQYEQHVRNYLQATSNTQSQRLIAANSTIIIPVVVHILYNNPAQNISDAVINSQITVLNEDFRRLNPDRFNAPAPFQAVGGDMNIEFRLACIDPNGNPTNGITRTPTSTVLFGFDKMKSSTTGGKDPWSTTTYLNIWVCNQVVGYGYAQFPSLYPIAPEKDGIVVSYNAFGITDPTAPKGLGRVATHEAGHWLGLYHPYDGIPAQNPCTYDDDLVDDTPPQRTSTGCGAGSSYCSESNCPTFPTIDYCTPGGVALNGPNGRMYVNFMDLTNDFCLNTFTIGQCNRARAAFVPTPNTFTRAEFIENYFSISKIGPAGCGETIISLQNPMCLPISWNISGNGTITQTSVANVYLLSGSGTVIVEARGANSYTDRKTFTFSPPDNISISVSNSGASATVTATASGLVNSYTWQTTNGVTINGQPSPVTTSSPTVTLRAPNCAVTNTELTIRANTSCGISDAVINIVQLNNSPAAPDIPTITFSPFNCIQRTALATTTNADYYVWETPNGFLINGLPSPQTTITNSITLSIPSGVSGIKGYVRVKGVNCTGESLFSTMTDVTIGAAPPIFTATVLDPYMGRYKGYIQAMQGASSYEWYQDQVNTPDPNFTGTFFQGSIPEGECGIRHTLYVRSTGSCGYSSFSSHEDIVLCEEFFISSPNPANETLNVATISPNSNGGNRPKIFQMKIFDQSGNLKKHWIFPSGVHSTSQLINFLEPGVYWLSANNGNTWKAKIFVKN